jgi:hypothetical protein
LAHARPVCASFIDLKDKELRALMALWASHEVVRYNQACDVWSNCINPLEAALGPARARRDNPTSGDCHGGSTVTADASHTFIPAGSEHFVQIRGGQYVAAIRRTADGFMEISERGY